MKAPKEKGQSLIEVIAALAIALLVLLALVRVTIVSMRNANFAKNQALATQYAQEAMEWIRTQRDADWSNLTEGTYCLSDSLSWLTGSCGYTLEGIFKREAFLTSQGTDKFQVLVAVSWASGAHKSELTSYLTSWQVPKANPKINGLTYVSFDGSWPGDLTDGVLVQAEYGGELKAETYSSAGGNYTLRGLEPNTTYYVVGTYLGYWGAGSVTTGDPGTTVNRNFYLF